MTSEGTPDTGKCLLVESSCARLVGQAEYYLDRVAHGSSAGRPGQRVKYRINGNSAKFYDKAYSKIGSVLRGAETTLNTVKDFRVYRAKEGGPEEDLQWRSMRKGIADLHRWAQVSHKANDRLLNALASVDDSRSVQELTAGVQKHTHCNGRRVRGLHPWAEDKELLTALNQGEFLINGFRNRDLQKLLYHADAHSAVERRRRSTATSRKLRLLRSHGLIQKGPRAHRYHVTDAGRVILLAILTSARNQCPSTQSDCEGGMKIVAPRNEIKI